MMILPSNIFYEIGKFYYDNPKEKTNGEFDIVILDELGYAFCEVKFSQQEISSSQVEREIEQVKASGLECYKYVFISSSNVKVNALGKNVEVICLDELYKF